MSRGDAGGSLEQLRVTARPSPEQVCGFCRDIFLPEEGLHTCETCGQRLHEDCFREELNGRCVTIGCDGYRPPMRQRIALVRARRRRNQRRRVQRGDVGAESRRQGIRTAAATLLVAGPLAYWVLSGASFESLIWLLIIPVLVVFALALRRGT